MDTDGEIQSQMIRQTSGNPTEDERNDYEHQADQGHHENTQRVN